MSKTYNHCDDFKSMMTERAERRARKEKSRREARTEAKTVVRDGVEAYYAEHA